jgi:hypothetical protein
MAPSLQRQDQISDAAYPDLKANQNMLALQEELTSTENKIGFPASVQRNAARHRTFLVTQDARGLALVNEPAVQNDLPLSTRQ